MSPGRPDGGATVERCGRGQQDAALALPARGIAHWSAETAPPTDTAPMRDRLETRAITLRLDEPLAARIACDRRARRQIPSREAERCLVAGHGCAGRVRYE